jgi:hypothetical protein
MASTIFVGEAGFWDIKDNIKMGHKGVLIQYGV